MSKVDPCLFMSKTIICVVYVYDCLFWARSQYYIDGVMKSFKEYGSSYNWQQAKVESVFEFLGIDIKTLDDGGFQFFQTGLIRKFLEDKGMEHCNGLPIENCGRWNHRPWCSHQCLLVIFREYQASVHTQVKVP